MDEEEEDDISALYTDTQRKRCANESGREREREIDQGDRLGTIPTDAWSKGREIWAAKREEEWEGGRMGPVGDGRC